jgi:hypothetical protein
MQLASRLGQYPCLCDPSWRSGDGADGIPVHIRGSADMVSQALRVCYDPQFEEGGIDNGTFDQAGI